MEIQKIVPFLWFDNQAEEAVKFYTSIFPNSKVGSMARYGSEGPGPEGTVMTGTFTLAGQEFMVLNGGPVFKFTEAISFFVHCETQAEVDELWEKLSEGGKEGVCGWLKDKFGVSWQIVPDILGQLQSRGNARKTSSMMKALLQMKKLDIEELKQAYEAG